MICYHSNNKHRQQRKILKAVRQKKQTTYKGKPLKITADFSTETLKTKKGRKRDITGTE
jgi:hypothetical protein